MLVTAPHLIHKHSMLLASRGCVAEAWQLVRCGLDNGVLGADAAAEIAHRLNAVRAAPLPDDHEVHGIFQDSVIGSLHFKEITDRVHAREAFRQAVRWIEVETSSQCNRRCSYCPNGTADRLRTNDFLDFHTYRKMIGELAEIDYDGFLNFVGNNEFFMHRENRRYAEIARQALPRAQFKLYSNGDHLSRDDLAWAMSVGVGLIHVTLHTAPTKSYDDSDAMQRALQFQKQIGIQLQLLDFVRGRQLQFVAKCGNTNLFVKAQDMTQLGHDWAGLVPGGGRTARVSADPCSYPIRQFIVTHDADLLMCCMTFKERTEENTRSGATVGNLADYPSIFQAYTSPGMVAWRKAAFTTKPKCGPCGVCPGFDAQETQAAPLAEYVSQQIAVPVAA